MGMARAAISALSVRFARYSGSIFAIFALRARDYSNARILFRNRDSAYARFILCSIFTAVAFYARGGGSRRPMTRNSQNRSEECSHWQILVGFITIRASSKSGVRMGRDVWPIAVDRLGVH